MTTDSAPPLAPTVDPRAWPPDVRFSTETMADGWPLRRLDWAAKGPCRGSMLFLVGRGDLPEKYIEALTHWHGQGWSITSTDWRGQGGSGRLTADPLTGHIRDFAVWMDDLRAIWSRWQVQTPGPHVIVAHSMGGHLALRGVVDGAVAPDALALSAPMLGFKGGGLPVPLMAWLVRHAARRWPERRAWPANERPAILPSPRQTYLTHDVRRYADEMWWRTTQPDLVLGPPSLGWLAAADASYQHLDAPNVLEAVALPVFLTGTDADALVDPAAIRRAAARIPEARLLMFGREAAHELLREADPVRDRVIAAIDAFLDEAAPAE